MKLQSQVGIEISSGTVLWDNSIPIRVNNPQLANYFHSEARKIGHQIIFTS